MSNPNAAHARRLRSASDDAGVADDRHIAENNPTKEELWLAVEKWQAGRFFLMPKRMHREMELKDKLDAMSEDEQLEAPSIYECL